MADRPADPPKGQGLIKDAYSPMSRTSKGHVCNQHAEQPLPLINHTEGAVWQR